MRKQEKARVPSLGQCNKTSLLLMLSRKHITTHFFMHLLHSCGFSLYACFLCVPVYTYLNVLCVCVCVCVYIHTYTRRHTSWPENNLPKQVTRQDFPPESTYRNSLILQIWSSSLVQVIFLYALTLTAKNKPKKKKEKLLKIIKMQQKHRKRSENVVVQTYSQMTYYYHLYKSN